MRNRAFGLIDDQLETSRPNRLHGLPLRVQEVFLDGPREGKIARVAGVDFSKVGKGFRRISI